LPGIYISWPFCAQKCTYCNFASGVQPKGLEDEYANALRAEIAAYEWEWSPRTLYTGGGTPSAMEPALFANIFSGLPGRPWREATIEAAPGSLTREKIDAWIAAGINRVSLGVQSFNKSELARTGRKHNAATVEHDVELLRVAGIENISLDLISGLPGQTVDSWRDSVAGVLRLRVPHASVYMLEVDEDSRLGAEIILGGKRYGAFDTPGDDRIAEFYEYAVEELARNGIHRYEISNFAKPGFESPHNLKYWRREPYIGFGSDAHSFDGVRRWQNVETAQDYVRRWRGGESSRVEITTPDPVEEKFFVGLRLTEGVEPDLSDWQRFGPAFERFLSGGVMERVGNRLRLTPRGIMVSNEVFQEFLTA
jgi:oxygen-independent coproporphyrinogen III oxidase